MILHKCARNYDHTRLDYTDLAQAKQSEYFRLIFGKNKFLKK